MDWAGRKAKEASREEAAAVVSLASEAVAAKVEADSSGCSRHDV